MAIISQISDLQHAYSGIRGTDTALSTLVNLIESAILRKQLCLVISVDIQGAFDNLAFMAIEKVMGDNNYPPYMIREGFRKKNQKKCGPGAHFGGGGSGKIFAGPQFYCDFWKIKPRW